MGDTQITEAIPHRPPMLLVDEIVSQTADQIVCRKTFRDDEFFLQGHYPGQPIVPGVILCECAAQAGAILLSAHVDGSAGVPVLTRLNEARFKQMVRPGETIEMEVTLNEKLAAAFFLSARVKSSGKVVLRFDFACTLAEAEA